MSEWSKIVERITKLESLLSLGGMVVASGLFAWIWSQVGFLHGLGWPELMLLGIGSAAVSMVAVSLGLIAWRYFRPIKTSGEADDASGAEAWPNDRHSQKSSDFNILENEFVRKEIHADDIFNPTSQIIDGKSFVGCRFIGPMNIYLKPSCHIHNRTMIDCNQIVVKLGSSLRSVVMFQNTTFKDCEFHFINFLMTQEVARKVKDHFISTGSEPPEFIGADL